MIDDPSKAIKRCRECRLEKGTADFHKDSSRGDGLANVCKECNKAKAKAWYIGNHDRGKAARREYYANNRDECREMHRKYREANYETILAAGKRWRQANAAHKRNLDKKWQAENPAKTRLYKRVSEQRRRAQKLTSSGSYTAEQILRLYKVQKAICACCRASLKPKYHIDHIVPLSRGGDNSIRNIQLLCPTCNLKKNAKDPIDFMRENGFLL